MKLDLIQHLSTQDSDFRNAIGSGTEVMLLFGALELANHQHSTALETVCLHLQSRWRFRLQIGLVYRVQSSSLPSFALQTNPCLSHTKIFIIRDPFPLDSSTGRFQVSSRKNLDANQRKRSNEYQRRVTENVPHDLYIGKTSCGTCLGATLTERRESRTKSAKGKSENQQTQWTRKEPRNRQLMIAQETTIESEAGLYIGTKGEKNKETD